MPMLPVFFMQSCLKDQLLKHVADAQGDALPAKAGARDEIEGRLPVQGELQRNAVEAVFQAQLCTCTQSENSNATACIQTQLYLRAGIEAEGAEGSDAEIIGQAGAESTSAPTQVDFTEVVATKGVLIGKLGAITGTDTNSAGLCGSHNGRGQDSGQNYKDFLHNK